MAIFTKIDSAGRIVIPKDLRQRYGMQSGAVVQIVPMPDGVSIVPDQGRRRFVRRGPILTIETGVAEATLEQFDVENLREERLQAEDPRSQT